MKRKPPIASAVVSNGDTEIKPKLLLSSVAGILPACKILDIRKKAMIEKKKLTEWLRLTKEARELARQARTMNEAAEMIEQEIAAELRQSGKRSISRHRFRIAWRRGRATVAWKKVFVQECGADKAVEVAESAAKDAPDELTIIPPFPRKRTEK